MHVHGLCRRDIISRILPLSTVTEMGERHRRRLERQFVALARLSPLLKRLFVIIHGRIGILLRMPLAVLLLLGGLLSFLPIFGLWMIPLGLMVLAIDVPALQPVVSAGFVRSRRWWQLWRRSRAKDRR